jgi:long-chain acyl-CoA synthetase
VRCDEGATLSNLSLNLTRSAAEHGDNVAIRADDYELTYAGLDDATARLVGVLRERGLEVGDRAAIMLPNVPAFAVLYFAILRAGGIVVPMNPLLKAREVEFYLTNSGAKLIFTSEMSMEEVGKGAASAGAEAIAVSADCSDLTDGREPVTDVVDRAPDDTAVILYTSGTTGRPKGAELTHDNLARNALVTAETLILIEPGDVVMGCLPLFHVFGQTCGLNAAVLKAATLTMIARFEPRKALEVIQRDKVTVFEGVPTMYAAMLHLPEREEFDTSSLRTCISGGAALPVEVLRGFEEAFGTILLEGYGLSETSPVASFNHPDRERKAGSIGTPVDGVEMRLVDDDGAEVEKGEPGEIAIRGHNIMKGYWGRPDETEASTKDGWFVTGDIATMDDEGYFYIVDRKKDVIIRGGMNVYPREVEEVLFEHPAVAEAAVIGMAHDAMGEEIGAAVSLKPGASATPEELREFVKTRLAAYKYPRKVWIVDALPKGPTGKILRRSVEAPADA